MRSLQSILVKTRTENLHQSLWALCWSTFEVLEATYLKKVLLQMFVLSYAYQEDAKPLQAITNALSDINKEIDTLLSTEDILKYNVI